MVFVASEMAVIQLQVRWGIESVFKRGPSHSASEQRLCTCDSILVWNLRSITIDLIPVQV